MCGLWALPFRCPHALSCSFCHECVLSHECIIQVSLPLFLWVVNFWSAILRIFLSGFFLPSPHLFFHFPFCTSLFNLKTCGCKVILKYLNVFGGLGLLSHGLQRQSDDWRLVVSYLERDFLSAVSSSLNSPKVGGSYWTKVRLDDGLVVVLFTECPMPWMGSWIIPFNFTNKALNRLSEHVQSSNSSNCERGPVHWNIYVYTARVFP